MKKCFSILLTVFLLMTTLFSAALAEKNDDDFLEYPHLGLKIRLTNEQELLGLNIVEQNETLFVVYTAQDGTQIITAAVYVYPITDYNSVISDPQFIEYVDHHKVSKIGENETYVYLLENMADFDSVRDFFADALDEEESASILEQQFAALEQAKPSLAEITNSIAFIPVEELVLTVSEFSVKDIYGIEYTQELFSKKDLTVVNIWGTFCGPCVNEMPELGEWAKSMPENVQIIGLVSDVAGPDDAATIETARQIAEATGADYLHLIAYTGLESLLNVSPYVPTTLFFDSEGKMVGQPVIGAYVDQYKDFVEEYLSEK